MARIFSYKGPQGIRQGGFSLIEVMVAVVVLSTGLLALAALQGALARNSADAKARSAVMAALTSRANEMRQAPPADGTTTFACSGGNWVCTAQTMGSIDSLTVSQTVRTMVWKSSTFSTYASGDDLTQSLFKRVGLRATWTDSSGASKTLALRSDISPKFYGLGDGYPTNDPDGSASKYPIVRQDNPSNTAGVIPIVTGNQATAASNPQPIIEGADKNLRVGTSFDVLNYVPEGSTAKITKRFQTEVIKCRCQYGQSDFSVAGKAQWPAVWDGTTYSVYAGSGEPTGVSQVAGEDPAYDGTAKGKKGVGRDQSEQCTECCRDHHDSSATAQEARYDPEASGTGKFDESNGVLTPVNNTVSDKYVAACRVVKVDGLWRTTADMYQRSYGLLETTADSNGTQAKSGIPSDTATSSYQTYVKDYLSTYTKTTTTAPGDPQGTFDGVAALNAPTTITIATPSTTDYRYLHARGLYVDYLGTKAQKAIEQCDGKSGTDYTECLLPVLPFTTINLTEMAKWTSTDPTVLGVNTDKSLNFNVTEPSGGRSLGIKLGTAHNNSQMRKSNSGVAVTDNLPGAVDDNGDTSIVTDSQAFVVGAGGGSGGGTGDSFNVSVSGGGSNPFVSFTVALTDPGHCTYDGSKFGCPTNSTLPAPGTVVLTNYNKETTVDYTLNLSSQCTYIGNGSFSNPGSLSVQRPAFTNFGVSTVTTTGTAAWLVTANTGKTTEETTITLSAIPKDPALIQVAFVADGTQQLATLSGVTACTYDKSPGNVAVLKSITWTKAWQ